jgi:large subunit ribosomal protein L35
MGGNTGGWARVGGGSGASASVLRILCERENQVVSLEERAYLARPMPKPIARSKTRKSVAKRFKVTGTGKVLRSHASRRHLMATKNAKRKRQLAKAGRVDKTDLKRIIANLPFG